MIALTSAEKCSVGQQSLRLRLAGCAEHDDVGDETLNAALNVLDRLPAKTLWQALRMATEPFRHLSGTVLSW
jgi:hypothetical protein